MGFKRRKLVQSFFLFLSSSVQLHVSSELYFISFYLPQWPCPILCMMHVNCPHTFIQAFLLPFTLNLFMHSRLFTVNKSTPDHQLSFPPFIVSSLIDVQYWMTTRVLIWGNFVHWSMSSHKLTNEKIDLTTEVDTIVLVIHNSLPRQCRCLF